MKKISLTHSRSSRDRYYLITGSMGCYGTPVNHVNNEYSIANGIDKGNGYQGYMSVSYFLTLEHIPQSAKNKVIEICNKENLIYNNQ